MSRSERPRRIKVCGVWFSIQYVEGLVDEKGEAMSGDCAPTTRKIRICTAQNDTPELIEATLLHEVLHAILFVTGQSQHLKSDREEGLVLALEHGLSTIYGRRR